MLIYDLLEIGVKKGMMVEARRRIVFSNAVFLIIGVLLLLYNLIQINQLIANWDSFRAYPSLLISITAWVCLWLNHKDQNLVSKVLFVLVWLGLIMIYPVVSIGTRPVSYFQHPYFGILFSPVIHLLFSNKYERVWFVLFLIVFFLFAVFSIDFLLMFDASANPGVPLIRSAMSYRINLIIFWLFLNLMMFYVLSINSRLYQALELKNNLIRNQNEKLDKLSVELSQQNRILENKVNERTKTLLAKNTKLREYTFMHSHILKAPLMRLKGLVNLFGHVEGEEKVKIINLIGSEVNNMDEVANSMSQKLVDPDE